MGDVASACQRRIERRRAPRRPVEIWVEESTDRELYFQRGANISAGGIYLERTVPHARGTMISIKFTLPGDSLPIQVGGQIVNVHDDAATPGMGVQFVGLTDNDRQRIERFVGQVDDVPGDQRLAR